MLFKHYGIILEGWYGSGYQCELMHPQVQPHTKLPFTSGQRETAAGQQQEGGECFGWRTSGANRWGEAQGPKDVKIQVGIFLFSARGPLAPFPNVFSKIPPLRQAP